MACMCTVSLGAKSKILGGCSAEDDVTQPDAVVKDAREDVECTRASDTNMSKAQVALYFAAFFGAGLSMALPYGAIQLRAPFWIHIYGSPSIWPLFVSMYNGPGLPCLLFLKWLDPKVEARLGLARAYALRCTLPLVLSTVLVIIIPFADHIVGVMAPLLFLLGLSNAAIYSWLFNFASLLRPVFTSALLGGTGTSIFVGLGMTALVDFGAIVPAHAPVVSTYFLGAAAVTSVGVLVLLCVICSNFAFTILTDPALAPVVEKSHGGDGDGTGSGFGAPAGGKDRFSVGLTVPDDPAAAAAAGDSYALLRDDGLAADAERATSMEVGGDAGGVLRPGKGERWASGWPERLSPAQVLAATPKISSYIRPLLLAGAGVNFVNVTAAAFVSYVPSADGNKNLPTSILVSSAMAYFMGNEAYVFVKVIKSRRALYMGIAFFIGVVALDAAYIGLKPFLNDTFTVAYVAFVSFLAAQMNSSVYGLVLTEAPQQLRAAALSLATIWIYIGTMAAVVLAFSISVA